MKKRVKSRIAMTISTLLMVVGVLVAMNAMIYSPDSPMGYRNPASQLWEQVRSGSAYVEQELAERVAWIAKRETASIGKPADPFESLRFGLLQGKYSVTMKDDLIAEIEFIDNPNSEGRPLALGDRKTFLKSHMALFGMMSEPERISIDKQGSRIVETYKLKNAKTQSEVRVSVVMDDLERVFAIKTLEVEPRKIF